MRSNYKKHIKWFQAGLILTLIVFSASIAMAQSVSRQETNTQTSKNSEETTRLLERARQSLDDGRYPSAERYAKKALQLDPANKSAKTILEDIQNAKQAKEMTREKERLAEEKARKESEAKRQAEREALERERAKKEATLRAGKISRFLKNSREELEHNDFGGARRLARKALNIEDNKAARQLLSEIDKSEGTYNKEQAKAKAEAEAKRQAELAAKAKAEEAAKVAREKAKAEAEAKRQAEKEAQAKQR
ncbi:MAG: hypothetical protein WBD12_03520, partial [Candidatus Omnitrophota bacterium]